MSDKPKDRLVWIDLEMTGLELESSIIEIASIVTDGNLDIIAEGPNIAIRTDKAILDAMDDWNTRQHTGSGLVDRILKSDIDVAQAEKMTLDFIKEHCAARSAPLCGNSIHHDKNFMMRYMPSIIDYLHYRIVDVSSFKEMLARWHQDFVPMKKSETHLALKDIHESIEELKYYRAKYFR